MGFLDTTSRGCALSGGFGGQLLTRGLSTSGFTGSLLGTSHGFLFLEHFTVTRLTEKKWEIALNISL